MKKIIAAFVIGGLAAGLCLVANNSFATASSTPGTASTSNSYSDKRATFESTLSAKAQAELKKRRETYKNLPQNVKDELKQNRDKVRALYLNLSPDAKKALKAKEQNNIQPNDAKIKAELDQFKSDSDKLDKGLSKEAQKAKKELKLSDAVKKEIASKRKKPTSN